MSVSRLVLTGSLLVAGALLAADDEPPEVAFIEYLGLWDESDEDWLMFRNSESDKLLLQAIESDIEGRSDPAPEGKESAEKQDES